MSKDSAMTITLYRSVEGEYRTGTLADGGRRCEESWRLRCDKIAKERQIADLENESIVMNEFVSMQLTPTQWLLLMLGATGVGVSKSGLAGVSMLHVLVFAFVFGARASTGVLLPLLIIGDICAVWLLGHEVVWAYVRRLMVPALVGIVIGWLLLDRLDEPTFRPLIGNIILVLSIGQLLRMWRSDLFANVPHAAWFVWMMGILTGITTMLANAAGPVVALYLLAIALPKTPLIATAAWFFLILNCCKVPLSMNLGLIDSSTLVLNLTLAPCVVVGLVLGRWIVKRIPQRTFDTLLLAFTVTAAMRLVGYW